jgi:hypothetical protein
LTDGGRGYRLGSPAPLPPSRVIVTLAYLTPRCTWQKPRRLGEETLPRFGRRKTQCDLIASQCPFTLLSTTPTDLRPDTFNSVFAERTKAVYDSEIVGMTGHTELAAFIITVAHQNAPIRETCRPRIVLRHRGAAFGANRHCPGCLPNRVSSRRFARSRPSSVTMTDFVLPRGSEI